MPEKTENTENTVEVRGGAQVTVTLDLAQFAQLYYDDDEGSRGGQITQAVARMIESDVNRDVRKAVSDLIQAKVGAIITEAISEPFRVVGPYGQETGQTTSLKELIMKEVTDWLSKPVRDGYSSNTGQTALQAFLKAEVGRTLQSELKAEIAAAKVDVLKAVRAQASHVITETIARVAQV